MVLFIVWLPLWYRVLLSVLLHSFFFPTVWFVCSSIPCFVLASICKTDASHLLTFSLSLGLWGHMSSPFQTSQWNCVNWDWVCKQVSVWDHRLQNNMDLTVPLASKESVGILWARIWTIILQKGMNSCSIRPQQGDSGYHGSDQEAGAWWHCCLPKDCLRICSSAGNPSS